MGELRIYASVRLEDGEHVKYTATCPVFIIKQGYEPSTESLVNFTEALSRGVAHFLDEIVMHVARERSAKAKYRRKLRWENQ